MDFNSTPINVCELLLMLLGLIALYWLFRQKADSNMPLLFYVGAIIFMTTTDRDFHPYLFYPGLGFALLLRFEFMNAGFSKFIIALEIMALILILWQSVAHIFGAGLALF